VHALYPGALRATNNRGLQPAMDHILENEGKPVPDPSAAAPPASARELIDVDADDEDEAALRSLLGTQTGTSSSVEEAKVRLLRLSL
jgi:hypothetical protein